MCWFRKAGVNCSHCEKCYRTILDILVNHGETNEFGFHVTEDTYKSIHTYLDENYVSSVFWKEIQNKFLQEKAYWTKNKDINWILDLTNQRQS